MIVFDTGALVALDRDDRQMWARLGAAAEAEVPILVPLSAIAQGLARRKPSGIVGTGAELEDDPSPVELR